MELAALDKDWQRQNPSKISAGRQKMAGQGLKNLPEPLPPAATKEIRELKQATMIDIG